MLLNLNYYAPQSRSNPLMQWSAPQLRPSGDGGSSDNCLLSSRAGYLMLLNSLLRVLGSFQGNVRLQSRPTFGLPRNGLLGPAQCFLGPGTSKRPARSLSSAKRSSVPRDPFRKPLPISGGATVRPLRQGNSISCGQTSVAMAVNSLTGKNLTDADVNRKHGFGLLSALRSESRSAGYTWKDGGNFQAKHWATVEKKLNREKTPVIMGLNGPTFSRSGRGHIVTLLSIDGDQVRYADPADGKIKTVSKKTIENAPGHPHGKFFFYASKVQ